MKLLIALASLSLLLTSACASAQPGDMQHRRQRFAAPQPVVVVTGESRKEADPDRAFISLGVQAAAQEASDAQQQVNNVIDEVLKDVRKLDVAGIQFETSSLSVYPQYEQRNPRMPRGGNEAPKIVGYRARNTLTVRMDDITRVGDVIDAAIGAGANEVTSLSFGLRDETGAQADALKDAVTKARRKAEAIAQAMNARLGDVVEVREAGTHQPVPYRAEMGMAMRADADTSAAIEPGKVDVRASVTITYKLASGG